MSATMWHRPTVVKAVRRFMRNLSPAALDAIINGTKVYINRRHDGSVYATKYDFTAYGVQPQKIVRVPFEYDGDPERHPRVRKALERCQ